MERNVAFGCLNPVEVTKVPGGHEGHVEEFAMLGDPT
jgi:hypothetical protein